MFGRKREVESSSVEESDMSERYDAIVNDEASNNNSSRDNAEESIYSITDSEAKRRYKQGGVLANIIDMPAEDAVREWIEIETNFDTDYKINTLIMDRLEQLKVKDKIELLIKYSRMYNQGGMLFPVTVSEKLSETIDLKEKLDIASIEQLYSINVLSSKNFKVEYNSSSPTKEGFGEIKSVHIGNDEVDRSRIQHFTYSMIEPGESHSALEVVLPSIDLHETALWSIKKLFKELALKIFKSSRVRGWAKEKLVEFLSKMRVSMNTQSAIALSDDESFEKQLFQISGLADGLNFSWDSLSGVSRMPKSTLMGNQQGVISAGQYDLIGYYGNVAKIQKKTKPFIDWIIDLIVHEKKGEIRQTLREKVHELNVDIKFKPLFKLTEKEEADIGLVNASADKTAIESGVLAPDEARTKRYPNLETLESDGDVDYNLEGGPASQALANALGKENNDSKISA